MKKKCFKDDLDVFGLSIEKGIYSVFFSPAVTGLFSLKEIRLPIPTNLFSYSCNQNYSTPHCTLGLLAKYAISQLFAINQLHKNCLSSLMKLILQGFYPNSTQNDTFNDFNEFTAVSKLFNPFMTCIFST